MGSEHQSNNDVAIYEGSKACAGLFNDCLSYPLLNQDGWASDQAASFKLWIEHIGAFARYSASADARLNTNLDVKQAVIGLLELLQLALQRTLGLIRLAPDSFEIPKQKLGKSREQIDSDEESLEFYNEGDTALTNVGKSPSPSSSMSIASQPTCDVEDLLMRLHQILIAVRTSRSRHASAKAAAFKYEDEEEFTQFMTWYMRTIFKKAYPDAEEYLITRLHEANLKRRRSFEYARQHSKKLAEDRQVPKRHRQILSQVHEQKTSLVSKVSQVQVETPQIAAVSTEQEDLGGASAIFSSTIFSAPVEIQKSTSSISVSGRSGKTFVTGNVRWPRRPNAPKNAPAVINFSCPYCCKPLPVSVRDEENRWREHVKADIQPYVCLFKECSTAQQLYSTRHEWLKHMEKDHGRIQYLCHISVHEQGPLYFDTSEAYENHMLREHADSFNASQLPMLVEKSLYRTALRPILETCPICPGPSGAPHNNALDSLFDVEQSNEYAIKRSKIEDGRSSLHPSKLSEVEDDLRGLDEYHDRDSQRGLVMHVMEHLQFIALLSLPWNAEQDSCRSETSRSEVSDGRASDGNQSQDLHGIDLPHENVDDVLLSPSKIPIDPAFSSEERSNHEWDFVAVRSDDEVAEFYSTDPILEPFLKRAAENTSTAPALLVQLLTDFTEIQSKHCQDLRHITRFDVSYSDRIKVPDFEKLRIILKNFRDLSSESEELLSIIRNQNQILESLGHSELQLWIGTWTSTRFFRDLVSHFISAQNLYMIFVRPQSFIQGDFERFRHYRDLRRSLNPARIARLDALFSNPGRHAREYAVLLRKIQALDIVDKSERENLTRITKKYTSISLRMGLNEYVRILKEKVAREQLETPSKLQLEEQLASQLKSRSKIADTGAQGQSQRMTISGEDVRKLRELIEARHRRDDAIRRLGRGTPFKRGRALELMAQSDAILIEIRNIVETWEPEYFDREEWEVVKIIKEGLLKDDKQIWEGNVRVHYAVADST